MQVVVNGNDQTIADASSVQQMLQELAMGAGRIAIEVNGEIVPRSTFAECLLQEGDIVEIVQAIGGG